MSKSKSFTTILIKFSSLLLIFFMISSCGLYKPTDARKVSPKGIDRAKKNIEEGKGFRLMDARRNRGSGIFEFASSNPMWRASVKLLEFTPFSNVDYSGGIIITDWFSNDETNQNESIKITVKFLSNEIRADGIDVLVYKRVCLSNNNNCKINKVESDLSKEIKLAILKEATILKELDEEKSAEEYDDNILKSIGAN